MEFSRAKPRSKGCTGYKPTSPPTSPKNNQSTNPKHGEPITPFVSNHPTSLIQTVIPPKLYNFTRLCPHPFTGTLNLSNCAKSKTLAGRGCTSRHSDLATGAAASSSLGSASYSRQVPGAGGVGSSLLPLSLFPTTPPLATLSRAPPTTMPAAFDSTRPLFPTPIAETSPPRVAARLPQLCPPPSRDECV